MWSAIGLPIMLLIGNENFADLLRGAYALDQHFRTQPWQENLPVIMGLLSVWYTNFFATKSQALIPYAHRLRYLVPYLQQAEMESNGKSVSADGTNVTYATGPVVFGDEGCNGQHTYHQLLHQGHHLIPVDFIFAGQNSKSQHHDIVLASCLSQAQALMQGKTYDEAYNELIAKNCPPEEAKLLAYHQMIPGNRPSNILFMRRLTPKNLGALLALYEHKIFVEGVIWDINSFDQWGVELGKQLLPNIVKRLTETSSQPMDSATEGLIDRYKKWQQP